MPCWRVSRRIHSDNNNVFHYPNKTLPNLVRVKIRFILPLPFLSGICISDVFSDYKTFSSMAFLLEMHNKRDMIF